MVVGNEVVLGVDDKPPVDTRIVELIDEHVAGREGCPDVAQLEDEIKLRAQGCEPLERPQLVALEVSSRDVVVWELESGHELGHRCVCLFAVGDSVWRGEKICLVEVAHRLMMSWEIR